MSKLSVLILAYNVAPYIEQTIESVLAQEVSFSYDIHIGDDGATDGTVAILKKFKEKYPDKINLHLTQREKKKRTGDYFNFSNMYKQITSEYLCVLDGDDYWTDKKKLQKQVDFLDAHKDFTICGHNFSLLHPDGRLEQAYSLPNKEGEDAYVAEDFRDLLLLGKVPYMQTATLLYRNVYAHDERVKNLFVSPMFSGDLIRTLLHADKGKTKYLNEVMSVYRILPAGDWNARSSIDKDFRNIVYMEYHRKKTFSGASRHALGLAILQSCRNLMNNFLKTKTPFDPEILWRVARVLPIHAARWISFRLAPSPPSH